MRNWKTTVIGVIGAIANALVTLLQTGTIDAKTAIISCAIAALGVVSKDFNVSHTQNVIEESKP